LVLLIIKIFHGVKLVGLATEGFVLQFGVWL